jgi:hypothetical protein
MSAIIKAIVKDGRIEAEAPAEWPEGTEVRIEPTTPGSSTFLGEEDWPGTPEAVVGHLERMGRLESLDLAPEDQTAWDEAREAQRAFEVARFEDRARALREGWE